MALLPLASTKDELWLDREGIRLVARSLNLGKPDIVSVRDLATIAHDEPKLRSGELIATFPAVAAARRETLKTVFLEVSSALKITAGIALRMKAMQEQIDRSTRAITVAKTTQMLAHDIRKPFSLVKMGLARLSAAKGDEEIRAVANRLAEETGRAIEGANRLIRDLLASGRAAESARVDAPLAAIIARSCEETLAGRSGSTIELSVDIPGELRVRVDALEIQRAVSNILDNAFDALSVSCGKAWMRAKLDDGRSRVALTISNNGPTIPPTVLPRLFEAYFTTGKTDGTGLGLAIAREIVVAHGGEITCRSDATSTDFVLSLPCARSSLVIRPERIALVDDNPFVLEAWEAKLGARVVLSASSPEGFWSSVTLRTGLFDELTLVITDQDFGDASKVDGLAFAAEIKARRADLQVLLSSDMPMGNQTTLIRGIDGVLAKEAVDAPQLVALFN